MKPWSLDLWTGMILMGLAGGYHAAASTISDSLLTDAVGAAGLPKLLAIALGLSGALLAVRSQAGDALHVTLKPEPCAVGLALLVANIAMVLVGLVILGPCLWLVNRPKPYLVAVVMALVVSGVYAIEQSVFDLGIVLAAGVVGYVMRQLRFPVLPMVLGVVLGFMVESNYRRSLVISNGDHMIFLRDKVSLVLPLLTAALLVYSVVTELRAGAAGEKAA